MDRKIQFIKEYIDEKVFKKIVSSREFKEHEIE